MTAVTAVSRPRRPRLAAGSAAWAGVVLAAAFLALPPMGTDLSAAVAHADFAARHGLHPVDFRWYGGTSPLGYSLLAPFVMAAVGVRLAGALAALAASVAFALLLARARARRPVLGALLGTVAVFGNLVSGRVSYALGVAVGLLALLAAQRDRSRAAAVLGALTALTSPVAGLFCGLAGAALLLSGRRRQGLWLSGGSAAGLLVTAAFGESGANTMSRTDTAHGVVLCLAVAVLCRQRPLRTGAVLAAGGVVLAFLLPTPVGLNAIRLPVMFALPLLLAFGRLCLPLLAVPVLLLGLYQPPLIAADLRDRGNPALARSYFAPLLHELARQPRTGRLEVPPTRDYGEAAYATGAGPLARGWLRQADTERNPLFFHGPLAPGAYQAWLVDNGVDFVALADAVPSHVGRAEADLVRGGLPYLREVWSAPHWRLYAVTGPDGATPGLVSGPGRLLRADDTGVSVRVTATGPLLLRVRYSRLLTLSGPPGCLEPRGRWTVLLARRPGRYRVGSHLLWPDSARCR